VLPGVLYVLSHLSVSARLFAPFVHTQDKLVQMWMPQQGLLAERYANAGKSLILALLYGPILPISYPIALAAVLFNTGLDRVVMLRLAAAPKQLNDMLMMSFNRMILISILLYVLVAFGIYFDGERGTTAPFVLAIVLWCDNNRSNTLRPPPPRWEVAERCLLGLRCLALRLGSGPLEAVTLRYGCGQVGVFLRAGAVLDSGQQGAVRP
jgi:hypothetical protein